MAIDYGESERLFLAALKSETGRDLGEWMAAIAAQAPEHRNDVIDWLRRQGFTFAKASWLERVHNNGGQPIYSDKPGGVARRRPARRASDAPAAPTPAVDASSESAGPPPSPPVPTAVARSEDSEDTAALDALLKQAKAYQPLARHLIGEVRKAVPDARFTVLTSHVEIRRAETFAVLLVSARELRLGLALPTGERSELLVPPRQGSPSTGVPITGYAALTDARQIGPALIDLVRRAATR